MQSRLEAAVSYASELEDRLIESTRKWEVRNTYGRGNYTDFYLESAKMKAVDFCFPREEGVPSGQKG